MQPSQTSIVHSSTTVVASSTNVISLPKRVPLSNVILPRSLVSKTIQINVPSMTEVLGDLMASYIPLEPASETKSSERPNPITLRIERIFNKVVYVNFGTSWEDTRVSLIEYCENKFPGRKVLNINVNPTNFCSSEYNSHPPREVLSSHSSWKMNHIEDVSVMLELPKHMSEGKSDDHLVVLLQNDIETDPRKSTLRELLDYDRLVEMLNTKNGTSLEAKGETTEPLTEKIIYDYINGICDLTGRPRDISIPPEDQETFISQIRGAVERNSAIQVSLQAGQFEQPLGPNLEEQRTLFRPLDMYLKEESNRKNFESLSERHRNYIERAANESYIGISEENQVKLMRMERELIEELSGENISIFKACMKRANMQNVAPKGFIHFRRYPANHTLSTERIYIAANKNHASELIKALLSSLYAEGEYRGVLDIKVSGPQVIGRTDGIVIYIGEVTRERNLSEDGKQRAIKEREAVIEKLKEIQRQHPELFADNPMPFKEARSSGIATIPRLSSSESFTKNLSKALTHALKSSSDVGSLRENTIKAFLEEPWMLQRQMR